ncbi:MAG: hypothetical protein HC896_14615 [Bacteroidales bacterium]|nr:hypothetical protein [Bacteroidales bacterium]
MLVSQRAGLTCKSISSLSQFAGIIGRAAANSAYILFVDEPELNSLKIFQNSINPVLKQSLVTILLVDKIETDEQIDNIVALQAEILIRIL